MLTDVCNHVHNYFDYVRHNGTFTVDEFSINGLDSMVANGQLFRVIGSAMNDGVYTFADGCIYDDDGTSTVQLKPETFTGTIAAMSVPVAFLKIVSDIVDWQKKNQAVLDSPYTSESFGGYSYSKAVGSGSNAGGVLGWQDVFRSRLNAYRKIS